MRPECLEFAPKDCLELLQSQNPQLWLVDLQKPVTKIIRYRGMHQIGYSKAMDAIIATNQTMADNILTMAAYQYIMDEKVKMYGSVVDQINEINQQLLFLDENKTTPQKDKQELRDFYQDKLEELTAQRNAFLSQPEVCKAIQVTYEDKLKIADLKNSSSNTSSNSN